MKNVTLASLVIFLLLISLIFIGSLGKSPTSSRPINTTINPPILEGTSQTNTQSSGGGNVLTESEVAKHSSKNDCYFIIEDRVYDVTMYFGFHPGGNNTMSSRCGKVVTGIFSRIHSNRAWDLLAKYKIADLASSNPTQNVVSADLNAISIGLKAANPTANVVNVKPKGENFVAKVIFDSRLFEIHLDKYGNIIKEEVEDEENDWSLWDTDEDDQ